jgi:methylmalonyl-CoA mutase N-terminal domain/subunit
VNKYRLEKEDPIDILEIDNTAVRLSQIERLKKLRAKRNEEEVQQPWQPLPNVPKPEREIYWNWRLMPQKSVHRWAKFPTPAKRLQDDIKQ